jgi:hypothetical protein
MPDLPHSDECFFMKRTNMSTEQSSNAPQTSPAQPASRGLNISLDWWSVIIAMILVALILFTALPSIPW